MQITRRSRVGLTLIGGLSLVGSLAGCAVQDSSATTSETTEPSSSATTAPEATTEATESADAGSVYTDGTYTETGEYTSPGGQESVTVTITLESDVVTAVDVVSNAENPNSKRYQGEFVAGIADVVVGQNIDELSVSKVAGSSLTSGGFNAAVDAIKADAS